MAITNPFQIARQQLPAQLFGQANIFGQQGASFLSSTEGGFDPNLAQSLRNLSIGQAQTSLGGSLADLAGQEARFNENQRQFDLNFGLQQDMFNAEKKAGKTNIWDIISGVASFGSGVGAVMNGYAVLKTANNPINKAG